MIRLPALPRPALVAPLAVALCASLVLSSGCGRSYRRSIGPAPFTHNQEQPRFDEVLIENPRGPVEVTIDPNATRPTVRVRQRRDGGASDAGPLFTTSTLATSAGGKALQIVGAPSPLESRVLTMRVALPPTAALRITNADGHVIVRGPGLERVEVFSGMGTGEGGNVTLELTSAFTGLIDVQTRGGFADARLAKGSTGVVTLRSPAGTRLVGGLGRITGITTASDRTDAKLTQGATNTISLRSEPAPRGEDKAPSAGIVRLFLAE